MYSYFLHKGTIPPPPPPPIPTPLYKEVDNNLIVTMQIPAIIPTFTGPDVSVVVMHSPSSSMSDCTISVDTQPTNGDATVTIMDLLSCRYARQRITYCLQFITDQCDSATVMESTDQCT